MVHLAKFHRNLTLSTYIATQSNKFTELRHGVWQIDYIYKTQLIRQSYTLLPLRRKNPRIDNIRGFFLVKRLGKPP